MTDRQPPLRPARPWRVSLLALALAAPLPGHGADAVPPGPAAPTPAGARGLPDCKGLPAFTGTLGFDYKRSAFTTADRLHLGLVYTELVPPGTRQLGPEPLKPKIYQHPTWTQAGGLGPFVMDRQGTLYLAPLPIINTLRNDPAQQNKLYRVDPATGVMAPYLSLPTVHPPTPENPFGILGLGYDCETGVIYASSVQGSDRLHELGRVYAVKTGPTPAVLDHLDDLDGFGLGVGIVDGKKQLFIGKARNSDIDTVPLGPDGRFAGPPTLALSLDGLGPRGDDRPRKIRLAENGELTVHGVEFYFNLTAPTEVQQTAYTFRYDPHTHAWTPLQQPPKLR